MFVSKNKPPICANCISQTVHYYRYPVQQRLESNYFSSTVVHPEYRILPFSHTTTGHLSHLMITQTKEWSMQKLELKKELVESRPSWRRSRRKRMSYERSLRKNRRRIWRSRRQGESGMCYKRNLRRNWRSMRRQEETKMSYERSLGRRWRRSM